MRKLIQLVALGALSIPPLYAQEIAKYPPTRFTPPSGLIEQEQPDVEKSSDRDLELLKYVLKKYEDENKWGHSFKEFKLALGNKRLKNIDEFTLKEYWKSYGPLEKEFLFHSYRNTEEFKNLLPPSYRTQFEQFDPKKLNPSEIKQFKEMTPWEFIQEENQYTESDRAALYFFKYVSPRL